MLWLTYFLGAGNDGGKVCLMRGKELFEALKEKVQVKDFLVDGGDVEFVALFQELRAESTDGPFINENSVSKNGFLNGLSMLDGFISQ